MTLRLSDEAERQIEARVRDGKYASAGEFDALLAEGEADGDDLDGKAVFAEFQRLHGCDAKLI